MNKLTIDEIYKLVLKFWDKKITFIQHDTQTGIITCVLYDSFTFKCNVENQYGFFEGGIVLNLDNSNYILRTFFGEKMSLNNDRESIVLSLKMVDNYCRMRLPDKYLVEYDKIIKT